VLQVGQHGHARGDAAAPGDQQQLGWCGRGQGEVAAGLLQLDELADLQVIVEVVGHGATHLPLHGDGEVTSLALDRARRIGPAVANTLDDHADDHVLARAQALEGRPGLQHEGGGGGGLGLAGDDPGPQAVHRQQRVDQADGVVKRHRAHPEVVQPARQAGGRHRGQGRGGRQGHRARYSRTGTTGPHAVVCN